MKQINLVNEYGSNYGEKGFPQNSDVWNQLRVTVIEKNDPDSLKSRLEKNGNRHLATYMVDL